MSRYREFSRREFLKVGALAGGGLLIALQLPTTSRVEAASAKEGSAFAPNAWIRIQGDGQILIEVARSEMGQGVMTSLPMLIAEELEVGLDQVTARFAPVDEAYTNRLIGQQLTGGSTSIRDAWTKLREAGALAREMLIAAAAEAWGVEPDQCRAESGRVHHDASRRQLGYARLAARAARQPVPDGVFLKEPEEFKLIGTRQARLDTSLKVNGAARFGGDVRLPDMLFASVLRCPVFGGTLARLDAQKAKAVEGVHAVLPISTGVAVVAENTWAALQGRERLEVEWDSGEAAGVSSESIREQFRQRLSRPGSVARSEGDTEAALRRAAKTVEAVYEAPFQAHACMEPMNCTADVGDKGCDVWVPTQAQTRTQETAVRITGLPAERVRVHTTFLGGGFGRRGEQDFVTDAVELSQRLKWPIQVIWSREDDIQQDYYRPVTYNRLRAGLGEDGRLLAWEHYLVGPSILSRVAPPAVKDGMDRTSTEGAANIPYAIANIRVEYGLENTPVPVGFWRSVGSSQNAFVTECFLDEVAAAAGQDPVALRRRLLAGAPRHKAVLELAAAKAGWGEPLPSGRHRGIAVAESFGSFVAQVAEVSVSAEGVRVHRVVCAVDCGAVVNPDTIEAQMESGIVYGLTATLKSAIRIDGGRVAESNFHDFPLLRMDEMPRVEVHIMDSNENPGGIGEPGTPPIAPAVANAVFAATGKPVRGLPIRV